MDTKKSPQRFNEGFKVEAVKQVTEKGFAVAEVAVRLGVSALPLSALAASLEADAAAPVQAQDGHPAFRRRAPSSSRPVRRFSPTKWAVQSGA